jgi:putative ABC transport system permease protein
LFGEFVAEVTVAIPIGLAVSRLMIRLIAHWHSNESFQIPAVIEPRTYVAAAVVVVGAAIASALVVRRRIDRLDLVAALKTSD